jgi:hypothetical protein
MKLEGAEKASPRSALGGSFANAKAEFARLKRDVTTGQTAAATPTPTPTPTPTTGTGKGAGKGKDDAARIAEQIRASKLQLTLAQDIFAIEGRLQQAQLEGNKQLVLARNAQKELAQIASQRADIIANKEMPALEKKNVLDKLAIDAATVSGKLGFDLAKIEQDRTKSFDAIIADLNLELALKTATTEQERERLRIEAARAKLQADLKGQGFQQPQIDQITGLQAQVAAPLTDVQKIDQHIGKLKDEIADLTSISNIAITSAEGIGKAFAQSFQGLISGSMTAKEALSSFFKSVADMFLEMAAQIIAKQITMIILQTILKALGAVGGGGGAELSSGFDAGGASALPTDSAGWSQSFATKLPGRAAGGPVTSQQPYMVGERGPELFVPGTGGSVVNNSDLRSAMNGGSGASSGSPVLNMSFQSTSINGVEYVSRDQLEQAMEQTRRDASRDGAKRGMTMTLDKLQQSPSTRSRVGMR